MAVGLWTGTCRVRVPGESVQQTLGHGEPSPISDAVASFVTSVADGLLEVHQARKLQT